MYCVKFRDLLRRKLTSQRQIVEPLKRSDPLIRSRQAGSREHEASRGGLGVIRYADVTGSHGRKEKKLTTNGHQRARIDL